MVVCISIVSQKSFVTNSITSRSRFPLVPFLDHRFMSKQTSYMSHLTISCEVCGIRGERGERRRRAWHEWTGSGFLTTYWDLRGKREEKEFQQMASSTPKGLRRHREWGQSHLGLRISRPGSFFGGLRFRTEETKTGKQREKNSSSWSERGKSLHLTFKFPTEGKWSAMVTLRLCYCRRLIPLNPAVHLGTRGKLETVHYRIIFSLSTATIQLAIVTTFCTFNHSICPNPQKSLSNLHLTITWYLLNVKKIKPRWQIYWRYSVL